MWRNVGRRTDAGQLSRLRQKRHGRIKQSIFFQKINLFEQIHMKWIGESIRFVNCNTLMFSNCDARQSDIQS